MSTDKLFDDFQRQHQGVADHSESTFSFLNRSARPASTRVRDILNQWYTDYPDRDKRELKPRFAADFAVGFFELLLYEILQRLEHKVEVHPIVSSAQGSHPDFRAKSLAGRGFILEAAVVTDESEQEKSKNRVLSVLFDQISDLDLPDYYLDIHEIQNPTGLQPSGQKISRFISQCAQKLDYESLAVLSQLGASQDLPRFTYREGALEIKFSFIPVSKENRYRRDHRPIGIYPGGTRWGGSGAAIQDKIVKKAGKYGHPKTSYIIAINYLGDFGTSKGDAKQALFGSENPVFLLSNGELKLTGKVNAAWCGVRGPQNKRVSAVLITRIFPWNLPVAEVNLFHNPWADFPYEGPLTELPQVLVSELRLKSVPGKSFGSILSLPNDWPGQLFDN